MSMQLHAVGWGGAKQTFFILNFGSSGIKSLIGIALDELLLIIVSISSKY